MGPASAARQANGKDADGKGSAIVSVLDLLRKGFGYVLMSMGVSSPAGKKPAPKPTAGPKSNS
jgi:hypothetical protein